MSYVHDEDSSTPHLAVNVSLATIFLSQHFFFMFSCYFFLLCMRRFALAMSLFDYVAHTYTAPSHVTYTAQLLV